MKESDRQQSNLTADMPDAGREPHRGLTVLKEATVNKAARACTKALEGLKGFLGEYRVVVGIDIHDYATNTRFMALCHCSDGREYEASFTVHHYGQDPVTKLNLDYADDIAKQLKREVVSAISFSGMTRTEMFLRYGKAAISK